MHPFFHQVGEQAPAHSDPPGRVLDGTPVKYRNCVRKRVASIYYNPGQALGHGVVWFCMCKGMQSKLWSWSCVHFIEAKLFKHYLLSDGLDGS